MRRQAVIDCEPQLRAAFREFYDSGLELVRSGRSVVLGLSEPTKSRVQEERYHAMIGEIAKQSTLHGKQLTAESWKRLLVNAFKHDTKDDPDLISAWAQMGDISLLPALNNPGFVMVGDQTRTFPKVLATAFIEWLFAWGAETGVRFSR